MQVVSISQYEVLTPNSPTLRKQAAITGHEHEHGILCFRNSRDAALLTYERSTFQSKN
jgi:hypothetical protein